MSNALLTPAGDGRFVRHTVETIDAWWHNLPADTKVRIFWLELQPPSVAGAVYDQLRNALPPFAEADGPVQPTPCEFSTTSLVQGAVHAPVGEVGGQVLDLAYRTEGRRDGDHLGATAAGHAGRLPNPVVDVAGPQVVVWDPWAHHNHRISLADACRLADEGAIFETTSYSDDHFDGSDVTQYFEIRDLAAFAREVTA